MQLISRYDSSQHLLSFVINSQNSKLKSRDYISALHIFFIALQKQLFLELFFKLNLAEVKKAMLVTWLFKMTLAKNN